MKYNVTFSCGHEGTVELFGSTSDRERKLNWLAENGTCPNCYHAAQNSADGDLPDCYPKGRWNKKVYGSAKKGYSIYVDGNKVDISNEDAEILMEYAID